MGKTQIDIVIPVFNEIEIMDQLHTRVAAACEETQLRYRIIYVDDGSHDGTPEWINRFAIDGIRTNSGIESIQPADSTSSSLPELSVHQEELDSISTNGDVTLIRLSRNFGQPAAILAGLTHAQGDCVVIMDGDLQDPPELIPEMVERWQTGDQVVIAQRTARKETFLRGLAFKAFHRCFRYLSDSNIPPNTGTFCLLDRKAADSICDLPESHRFFPGLRAWVGFNQSMIQFSRPPRAGGEPKQSFVRLLSYALDAVFGYSYKPLRLLTGVGTTVCVLAFMIAAWFVFKRIAGLETASIGFTTITCLVTALCGFQLIGMGILGEYIGRIYDEVKQRPQFIVSQQSHSDQFSSQVRTSTAESRRLVG